MRSPQRLGLAEELPVVGLGPEAVAALARTLLGDEPPAALLGALRERTAGTPLFVSALIRGPRDAGELFRSGGRWVVGTGSVTAEPPVVPCWSWSRSPATPRILARVDWPGAHELDGAIGRLCESGLVVEEPTGTDVVYRAAHPLVAEVAYGELPQTRRRRLHAGVAALALAHSDRPAMVEELLEHLGRARARAGQLEVAAAAWSEAAGERERSGDRRAAGFRTVEGTGADTELIDLHHVRLELLARLGDVSREEEAAVALLPLAEGSAGVHLHPGASSQQWLDRLLQGKDPSEASSLITVDFPVPDMPVSSTRFIAARRTTWAAG